eukprot:563601-Rhodomonas_salina.1
MHLPCYLHRSLQSIGTVSTWLLRAGMGHIIAKRRDSTSDPMSFMLKLSLVRDEQHLGAVSRMSVPDIA